MSDPPCEGIKTGIGGRLPIGSRPCKEGNSHLRDRLVQCASTAVHTVEDPYLTDFYKRLRRKNKPKKVALVATGRKLLVAIFYKLKRTEEYDPDR